MTVVAPIIFSLEDAAHRRASAERAASSRWDDPEYRKLLDRSVRQLEAEHRHALVELRALEEEIRQALELLGG